MVAKIVDDFDIRKKSKFMRSFNERLAVVNEKLCKKFDDKKSAELISQMTKNVEFYATIIESYLILSKRIYFIFFFNYFSYF